MNDYEPILVVIAADFGRKFRQFGVEAEDVAQELRIWVYRHPEKIAEWEATEDGADRLVARTLRHEANRYAQQIKAQQLGYSYDDLAWYSRNELRTLLDAMFDREAWTEPPVSGDGRSQRDPATGGNWIALLADVSRAYSRLSAADQALLRSFHYDHMTNVMLADLAGVTEQAMSARHNKALNRLLRLLGGERPKGTHDEPVCECEQWVGTRRAMSNATAQAITQSTYDED